MAIRARSAATDVDQAEVAALGAGDRRPGPSPRRLHAAASGSGPAERLTVVGVVNTLRQSPTRRNRLAGLQAGAAGPAAGPGHPAGGPVPGPPGDREPAAGHRHAHHLGRARAGLRGRAGQQAGAGTRLQRLLDLGLVASALTDDLFLPATRSVTYTTNCQNWLRRGRVCYAGEGRHRRARGQHRHRHRQVRGFSLHRLGVDARRVGALGGRHGNEALLLIGRGQSRRPARPSTRSGSAGSGTSTGSWSR